MISVSVASSDWNEGGEKVGEGVGVGVGERQGDCNIMQRENISS